MIKKVKPTATPKPAKTYAPMPHPQQARIDEMRVIPSLVTCNPELAPKGK